jgi:hypothetical protein
MGDMAYNAADFIHMGVQHDAGTARALACDHRAQAVIAELVRQGLHFAHHDLAHRLLESGRRGRFRQGAQKLGCSILRTGGLDEQAICRTQQGSHDAGENDA